MAATILLVKALYDFNSADSSSLSFKRNDIIQVITQLESGWWDGFCNGQRGWFPSNYVTTIEEDEEIEDQFTDWIPQQTPDGKIFYFNQRTFESSWELPSLIEDDSTTTTTIDSNKQNWIQKPTEDGNTYYYFNTVTEEIRWTYPGGSSNNSIDISGVVLDVGGDNIQQLPPNWGKKATPQGKVYYFNKITDETTWSLDNVNSDGQLMKSEDILTWESLYTTIITAINGLNVAAKDNSKQNYQLCTNTIVESIRIMLYASGTVEKESPAIRQNRTLKIYHRHIMASLSKLVLSTEVASGVWPPPDSAQKMMSDAEEVSAAVGQFVQAAENVVDIRRVDPKILESVNGGAWKASLDHISRNVNKAISLLLNHVKKYLEISNFAPQLILQTRQVVTQVGQFLAFIEDINLEDLDETSQGTINEFKVAKQTLYNNIAGLVISTQSATTPPDGIDQVQQSTNIVEKSVTDVIVATKFLVEEKDTQDQLRINMRISRRPIPENDVMKTATSSSDQNFMMDDTPISPISENSSIGGRSKASSTNNRHRSGTASKSVKPSRFFGEDPPRKEDKSDKPWFLNYDYESSEIVFNMENHVKGGTLKALVERLTMHDVLDSNFIATFLLTYRSFCTTDEFFDMLVKRFLITPPENLTKEENETWIEKKQTPIRLRVFNIMKGWLENYYIDGDDSHCLERIREFVSTVMHENMAFASASLIKVIETRQQQKNSDTIFKKLVPNAQSPPPSILPKSMRKLKFLDLDPLEIARQLTIIESRLYNKIKPVECLNKAWSKSEDEKNDDEEPAQNIKAMIVNRWVAESILNQPEVKKRCALIKHFVAVADKCRSLNNFNSLTAIISGLNSAPIHRLKRTWEMVNAKPIQTLENLNRIMNSTKNFCDYREMLHSVNPPCVYLTDLTFIEDGNPNTIKKTRPLINFSKRMKTAEVIREIQQYQSVPYNLNAVQEIQIFIQSHLQESKDVGDLYDQSLNMEPREREDEKIARLLQERLAYNGISKKSLSISGAISAFLLGFGTLINEWSVFPVIMLVFYFTSSKLTKYKAERKKQLEEDHLEGGQRTATQVICNALTGTVIALIHQYHYGGNLRCLIDDRGSRMLLYMCLGHYSTCNGDTWASELGILNTSWPILITSFKKVPPGTNGGISELGLFASIMGGFIIGISAVISIFLSCGSCNFWLEIISISSLAGLLGSLIDSFLGATIQISVFSEKSKKITYKESKSSDTRVISGIDILDNNQINFVSSLLTALLTGYMADHYEKQNTQSALTTGLDDPDSRYRKKQAMSKPGSHIMPNPVMSKPSHLDDDSRYRSKLIPMITEEDMARYRAKKAIEEQARKQMQDDDSRYRSKLIPMITEEDMARYRAKQAAQNQSSTSKHSEVEDESKYRSKLIPHITEEDIARHNAKKAAEEKAKKQMQDDDPRYRSQLIPMITEEDIERHRAKKAAEEQTRKQMQDDDRYRSRTIPMITEEDMARHRAKKAAEEQTRKQMQDDDRYRSRMIPMITEEDMARHRAKKAAEEQTRKQMQD
ncbi:7445_t:CDS:10, partial [Diversispora eburnea]